MNEKIVITDIPLLYNPEYIPALNFFLLLFISFKEISPNVFELLTASARLKKNDFIPR